MCYVDKTEIDRRKSVVHIKYINMTIYYTIGGIHIIHSVEGKLPSRAVGVRSHPSPGRLSSFGGSERVLRQTDCVTRFYSRPTRVAGCGMWVHRGGKGLAGGMCVCGGGYCTESESDVVLSYMYYV